MPAEPSKFRSRKLDNKRPMPIYLASEIEAAGGASCFVRQVAEVSSGVEKEEEKEHHLQAAISSHAAANSSSNAKRVYIPVPEALETLPRKRYNSLYPATYTPPNSLIRYSSIAEDIDGSPYNLDEDDDIWLSKNRPRGLTDDDFETIMNALESLANAQAKCESLDPAVFKEFIPSLEDAFKTLFKTEIPQSDTNNVQISHGNTPMTLSSGRSTVIADTHLIVPQLPTQQDSVQKKFRTEAIRFLLPPSIQDDNSILYKLGLKRHLDARMRCHMPAIYSWWYSRRIATGNRPIAPCLLIPDVKKAGANENSAYGCFRKREVKANRKTRRTEVQGVALLRKLRADLTCIRILAKLIQRREIVKRDFFAMEQQIFNDSVELLQIQHLNNRNGSVNNDNRYISPEQSAFNIYGPLSTLWKESSLSEIGRNINSTGEASKTKTALSGSKLKMIQATAKRLFVPPALTICSSIRGNDALAASLPLRNQQAIKKNAFILRELTLPDFSTKFAAIYLRPIFAAALRDSGTAPETEITNDENEDYCITEFLNSQREALRMARDLTLSPISRCSSYSGAAPMEGIVDDAKLGDNIHTSRLGKLMESQDIN